MSALYRIKDPDTGYYHRGSATYDPSTRAGKVYSSTGLKTMLSHGFVVRDDWRPEHRVLGSGAVMLARLVVEEVGTGNTWPLAEWRESAG